MLDIKPKITVIIGPGSHGDILIDAIKNQHIPFEVFSYHPKFSRLVYDQNGIIIKNEINYFLSFVTRILWAITIRIKPLKKKNIHSCFQLILFDKWVSNNYSKSSKLLWAWSQASLKTMIKFRAKNKSIILEHPTIHVDEWNGILSNIYSAQSTYNYYYTNKLLTERIKKEYKLADKIICLSKFTIDTFKKYHFKELNKLEIIQLYPNEIFNHEQTTRDATFNIVFVGRVDRLKGIHLLLPVFRELRKEFQHIKLTLIGDVKEDIGELLKEYQSEITLKGSISKKELNKEYNNANLLVLPSIQESFGLVILEALQCEIPVLASVNSGGPDIAEHNKNVYLFDPSKRQDLKNKLKNIIQSNTCIKENKMIKYTKEGYEEGITKIINYYI